MLDSAKQRSQFSQAIVKFEEKSGIYSHELPKIRCFTTDTKPDKEERVITILSENNCNCQDERLAGRRGRGAVKAPDYIYINPRNLIQGMLSTLVLLPLFREGFMLTLPHLSLNNIH